MKKGTRLEGQFKPFHIIADVGDSSDLKKLEMFYTGEKAQDIVAFGSCFSSL
jgi:hypothetical protein